MHPMSGDWKEKQGEHEHEHQHEHTPALGRQH
jgi:hypothetical protein